MCTVRPEGQYNVAHLVEKHGADMPICDFIDIVGRICHRLSIEAAGSAAPGLRAHDSAGDRCLRKEAERGILA